MKERMKSLFDFTNYVLPNYDTFTEEKYKNFLETDFKRFLLEYGFDANTVDSLVFLRLNRLNYKEKLIRINKEQMRINFNKLAQDVAFWAFDDGDDDLYEVNEFYDHLKKVAFYSFELFSSYFCVFPQRHIADRKHTGFYILTVYFSAQHCAEYIKKIHKWWDVAAKEAYKDVRFFERAIILTRQRGDKNPPNFLLD